MAFYKSYEKYLLEADDDDNESGAEGGQTIDMDADDDNGGSDEGNQDNDTNDSDNNDDGGDDSGSDDYDIDDGGNIDAGGDDDDGGSDDSGESDTADSSVDSGDDEGEKIENPGFDKIYDQMTPKEKSFHDHELRQQFKKLFRSINAVIEKTVALPRTTQTLDATTNLLHTLFDFKKYILFYIEKQYENKTLLENTIEYWKYMSILSAYKSVYKELNKILLHKDDD